MAPQRYALVAYVRNEVGEFVENLRRELHPELPHLAAHVTLLPPRLLSSSEPAALEVLERHCKEVEPFEVSLGEVETFIPVTPTVFIRVAHAAYRMRELHDLLNIDGLKTEDQAQYAYRAARTRWAEFEGSRSIEIRDLTLVREEAHHRWVDLADVSLEGARMRVIDTASARAAGNA